MEKLFLSDEMPAGIKGVFVKAHAVGKQGVMSTIIVEPNVNHEFPHDVWEFDTQNVIGNAEIIQIATQYCHEQFPFGAKLEVVMKFPEDKGTSYVFKVTNHAMNVED